MQSVGIIAEYNPFHNAHAYHISRALKLSGAENAIVCMSASFVQRGEPACLDKFTRARHALSGGADMVIELPDLLCCACAERFAYGGVRLLAATGLIDSLAFGSECGDIEALKAAASVNLDKTEIKRALSRGVSYPEAAAAAFSEQGLTFDPSAPNDILAIEYIRQISRLSPTIRPIAIRREGAGYNENALEKEFASASALRLAAADMEKGGAALEKHVPMQVFSDMVRLYEAGRFPAGPERLSPAVLYALRALGAPGIGALADVSEGLENPISRAALTSSTVDELLSRVKTRRYTLARLKRILIYALIGTTAELQGRAFTEPDALYIRVLGVKKCKLHLLSELSKRAALPVVISASDAEKLPECAKAVLEHSRRASLIRALACPRDKACTDDFSHALVTV